MKTINYKLINIFFVTITLFLIFKSIDLYKDIFSLIISIILPIFLSFFISYSLYPCVKLLNKKFSYNLSSFLVVFIGMILLFIILFYSVPIFIKEIYLIFEEIKYFLLSSSFITDDVFLYFKSFLTFNNGIFLVNKGASFITSFFITFVLSIYFLFNMENIKKYLRKYKLFYEIDKELYCYYKGFYLIILIEIIEYFIIYFLIGHPYFLLIAVLSGITTVIPFIGALFTNSLALITSYSISKTLFIMTAIVMIIIPIFNNYFIEPRVYNKTLRVSLISVIISCFVFGNLFGFLGIIFAIPLFIIIKNLLIFFFPRIKEI